MKKCWILKNKKMEVERGPGEVGSNTADIFNKIEHKTWKWQLYDCILIEMQRLTLPSKRISIEMQKEQDILINSSN